MAALAEGDAAHDRADDVREAVTAYATGQLDNNAEIRTVRRQIARINTYIRQREIAAAESGK